MNQHRKLLVCGLSPIPSKLNQKLIAEWEAAGGVVEYQNILISEDRTGCTVTLTYIDQAEEYTDEFYKILSFHSRK